jgi:hypothetical protein
MVTMKGSVIIYNDILNNDKITYETSYDNRIYENTCYTKISNNINVNSNINLAYIAINFYPKIP